MKSQQKAKLKEEGIKIVEFAKAKTGNSAIIKSNFFILIIVSSFKERINLG